MDTTPPAVLDMVYTNGVNLLYNPSFEEGVALNANLTQCDAQPPTSWEVSVTSYCVTVSVGLFKPQLFFATDYRS